MDLTSLVSKVVGILKAPALILFPGVVATKARMLERAGLLNVVLLVCVLDRPGDSA